MENLQNGNSQSNPHLHSFEPTSSHDDFLEQILSNLPNCSWPDTSSNPNPNPLLPHNSLKPPDEFPSFDDLSSKLRLHANSSSMAAAAKSFLLHQQLLLSRGLGSPSGPTPDSGLMPLPLSLAGADSMDHHRLHVDMVADTPSFKSTALAGEALFNAFPAALHGNGQTTTQQPFQAGATAMNQPPASVSTGGSGQPPQRQRIRARRGQATDPHSIAERLRRERIAERMKALQELVPNGNKTDKASMLDEIIDYVKFLQLQVKVLSMSRLGGGAAAVPPLVADRSSQGVLSSNNGNAGAGCSNEGMVVTENQVVKLMEEDMGSAMQYLQGKGLCLMPISLATAISTATCHSRNTRSHQQPPPNHSMPPLIANGNGGDGSSSSNLSGLTVQSANLVNGHGSSIKDSNPASKA